MTYRNEHEPEKTEKVERRKPKCYWIQTIFRNKTVVRNAIAGLTMFVLNFLYVISNETCSYSYDNPNICNEYFKKMYAIWVLEAITVGLLWFLLMVSVIHKVISKVWLLFLAANFVFILFYMTGMEWADHGAINRFVFLCTITVLFTIYSITRIFIKIWKFNRLVFHLVIF